MGSIISFQAGNSPMDFGAFHLMGRLYFLILQQLHIYCMFEANKLNSSELFGYLGFLLGVSIYNS